MAAHQAPVPGILQATILEWIAIFFSSAWKWKVKVMSLSRIRLFATPWTVAYQAPPSMGFPRQEYWSGLPLPSPVCDISYVYIFFSPFLPPHILLGFQKCLSFMIICMALNNIPMFSPPSLRNKTASINYCVTGEPVEMEVWGHCGYLFINPVSLVPSTWPPR